MLNEYPFSDDEASLSDLSVQLLLISNLYVYVVRQLAFPIGVETDERIDLFDWLSSWFRNKGYKSDFRFSPSQRQSPYYRFKCTVFHC